MLTDLEDFMEARKDNKWFRLGWINIYLRVYYKYSADKKYLDIASVSIENSNKRGKGLFTALLGDIETYAEIAEIDVVRIENVLSRRFKEFFEKQGYSVTVEMHNLWCLEKKLSSTLTGGE